RLSFVFPSTSTSIESGMYPTLIVFMNASWDANASLASGSVLAHLNHMGMAYRRNFWTSSSESRITWTPLALYLSQASMFAFWIYAYWSHECWRVAAITRSCRCVGSAFHFPRLTVRSMRSTGWWRHGVEVGPMMMYFATSAKPRS